MDKIFWICVEIMHRMSDALGITYQQLNVWLFVIIHPALTVILFIKYWKYRTLWKKTNYLLINVKV
jgi:hypothetical protein